MGYPERLEVMERVDAIQRRVKRIRQEAYRMNEGELDFALHEVELRLKVLTLDIDRG